MTTSKNPPAAPTLPRRTPFALLAAAAVAASVTSIAVLSTGCGPAATDQAEGAEALSTSTPPEITPAIWPALESPVGLDPDIERKIDEILAKMSVEEKVGQIMQSEIRFTQPEDVAKYHLGSVLNGGGSHPGDNKQSTPADWLALADAFWEASMDTSDGGVAIPILWGTDAVHGHSNVMGATLFPHNIGLGAGADADLVREIAQATAAEVTATGQDWNFAPTLAVVRDLRWGRSYESYSSDPAVVAELGAAYVEGVQGRVGTDEFLGDGKILATAKHFLGDGGTQQGIDQGDNIASETDLRDIHGAGYVTTLDAGAQSVMASFSSWHGRKMHGHHGLLTDVLKGRMGFDGLLVGDWNGHGQVATCSNESCARAVTAGIDLFMVPEDWKALIANTLDQVAAGDIPMERLDDAVRRVLRVKFRAGLFDAERKGMKPSERAGADAGVGSDAHRDVARRAVRRSLVLLKNQDGVLPLAPSATVLVAGPGAEDFGRQTGGWTLTWQGTDNEPSDFPGATTICQGLRDALAAGGGKAIVSADGSYAAGQKPDAAVVVFGETPYAEFQGDRLTLQYSPGDASDLELLRKLRADGIPVVSVFLSGRPLWVNPHLNASDAFVAAWLPGSEGQGIADVLIAAADGAPRHDFVGKLPYAWPASVLPADGDAPLFAYGHGLTYADEGTLAELSEEVDADAGTGQIHTYFDGGPVAPWRLTTDTPDLAPEAVDRTVQEDARRLSWPGNRSATVRLSQDQPVDLRRESNGGLALAFDVQVESAPSAPVHLAMSGPGPDGTRSEGAFDIAPLLSGHADGDWHQMRVALRCFEQAGQSMEHIDTPWSLRTEGDLSLVVSDVRLVSAAEGDAPCPQEN